MEKAELRNQGLLALKQLSQKPQQKKAKEEMIRQLFFASEIWQKAQTIGLFRSTAQEFDTKMLLERGFKEGKRVVVPEVLPERQLAFHEVTSTSQYALSNFGIEEPVVKRPISKDEIDLLVVPGVVFNYEGYRIGYGGGYYDRFLADFNGTTVSLVFSEQFLGHWQPDTFDVPVKRIVTDRYRNEE